MRCARAPSTTPSTHRVHHARNRHYIDRNYAGVLVIWDRLLGTYVPEDPAAPCEYGIVGQVRSHNPITLTFHEWIAMLRDARRAGSLRAALGQLVCPPERALSHPARNADDRIDDGSLQTPATNPVSSP